MAIAKEKIIELLKDHDNQEDVKKFASYILRLVLDMKYGKPKNYWVQNRTEAEMADLFKRVAKEGLVFDGVNITLQSTGISYNYVAFRNKMLLVYPESKIDLALVYEGDKFSAKKKDGKVFYDHEIANPFGQKDEDIKGGYCIIKNKRGEYLETMSPEEIEKHRKVAKTDYIWRSWFREMCKKTIIKKACSQHFRDVFAGMEKEDNRAYELENPVNIDLKWKQEIDEIQDVEALRSYYLENKGRGKEFDEYITIRKKQLTKQPNETA